MAPKKPLIEIAIETLKAEVNLLEKKKNKLTSGENYLQSQIQKEKRNKLVNKFRMEYQIRKYATC